MKATKWLFGAFGTVLLVALLASAVLVGSALWFGTPLDHAVLRIDDTSVQIADLGAGHWLLAFAGVALACAIVMLVVPLAVLLPLALAAIGVTIALAVAAAAIGVVFSPLILVVALVWWALRRRDRAADTPAAAPAAQTEPPAPATIAG